MFADYVVKSLEEMGAKKEQRDAVVERVLPLFPEVVDVAEEK